MRATATSNKRNSSSSTAAGQHQRKAPNNAKRSSKLKQSSQRSSSANCQCNTGENENQQQSQMDEEVIASSNNSCNIAGDDDDHRKQNHCEIEKRRRDKMNHYIMELASVIPSFTNNQSKFDKLTVLRMAVQHVKSLRSSLCSFSSFHLRPSFLSSGNLLKNLILQMASQESQDNLFMVVTCDRGKVLFVSQSSKDILNQDQNELIGQCLFDILHKDDVSKVKEQISYFNLMPKEMLVDSKTLQPIRHNQRPTFTQLQNQSNSTPQPGARRSFFCRMKSGRNQAGTMGKPSPSDFSQSTSSQHDHNKEQPEPSSNKSKSATGGCRSEKDPKQNKEVNLLQRDDSETTTSNVPAIIDKNLGGVASNSNTRNNELNSSNRRRHDEENSQNVGDNNKNNSSSNISSNRNSHSHASDSSNSGQINSGVTVDTQNNDINDMKTDSVNSRSKQSSTDKNRSYSTNSNNNNDSNNNNNNRSDKASKFSLTGGLRSKKQWRYIVMHCTGYLKSLTLRNDEFDDDDCDDYNSSDDEDVESFKTINCLVAVCRRSSMDRDLKPDRPLTFTCRYSMEGKFVFVDQRTTVALGYTPQQLMGTSHYAYCHKDSVNTFKECHRQSILKSEPVSSDIYQFKRANGQHLWLQTSLKSFRNPWTKFIDYIVANHTTAEGSDPHYNEGCVPTKFNQDMTGEASQSSSPASSSSLSLPSMDSKKSSSPSSSSMGSSYSMESYASGGSVQALLNQIDKMKTGDTKLAPDFHKKRNIVRSSSGSARKSNEDSGNYSDPQSCSSLSSQNSAQSTEYANIQGIGNFVYNGNNHTAINGLTASNSSYYNPRVGATGFRSGLAAPTNFQPLSQQATVNTGANVNANSFEVTSNNETSTRNSKLPNHRTSGKVNRPVSSMKQHQRHYGSQYHYRNQSKTGSSTSSDTGNETASWSNSSGSVYSNSSSHQVRQQTNIQNQIGPVAKAGQEEFSSIQIQGRSCSDIDKLHRPPQYIMQAVASPMNIVPATVAIHTQIEVASNQVNESFPNEMMPVTYMNEDVNTRYNDVELNQIQHMNSNISQNMSIPQEHQATVQRLPTDSSIHMNVPMIWNSNENPYQNLNNTIQNDVGEQICNPGDVTLMNIDVGNSNNQMIAQQIVHCQQCANHKCSNQQSMMSNNTDLNSINLTSLAVDGDLDEDQLLEYLAGCDPEAQLYHIQNNAFPQYNIYR